MSLMIEAGAVKPLATKNDWSLWLRQIRMILRLEVKKNFWGKRALLIYLFAIVPVFIVFLLVFTVPNAMDDIDRDWNSAQAIFGYIFGALILRTMVFFGCAWIFMNLFRGEIVDKSLHYYFL